MRLARQKIQMCFNLGNICPKHIFTKYKKGVYMELDLELLEDFTIESKEHLENCEQFFMDLEKASEADKKEIIGSIFRAIHSIKGAAGFFALNVITNLSHKMETILSMMREEEIEPSEKYIDKLLIGCDILNNLFDDLSDSNNVDTSQLLSELENLINPPSETTNIKSQSEVVLEDNNNNNVDFQVDSGIMKRMHKKDNNLFLLRYDIQKHQHINPFVIVAELSKFGTMIDGKINSIETDNKEEPLSFYDILYSTSFSKDEVIDSITVDAEFIVTLTEKNKLIDQKELFKALETVVLKNDFYGKEKLSIIGQSGKEYNFDIDPKKLQKYQEEHHFVYVLHYNLNDFKTKNNMSMSDWLKEIELLGKIHDIIFPVSDSTLEDNDINVEMQILFSTILDADMINTGVCLNEKDIDRIIPIEEKKETLMNTMVLNRTLLKHFDKNPPTMVEDTIQEEPGKVEEIVVAKVEKAPIASIPVEKIVVEKPKTFIIKQEKSPVAVEKKDVNTNTAASTIRIKVDVLEEMMRLAGELVLIRNQQLIIAETASPKIRKVIQSLDLITSELQDVVMKSRMQPIGSILSKFPRIVRDLSKQLDKRIELEIIGKEVELDKTILENLTDPLTHMIRNCCDHAIEAPDTRLENEKPAVGIIRLKAFHESENIVVQIEDDGKGLDPEMIGSKALEKGIKTQEQLEKMSVKEIQSLIMAPGFSTAQVVSDVSGRGVGMDVVKTSIDKLGGVLDFESTHGVGTTITLKLPLTLAIIPCLIIENNKRRYAIPQLNIERSITLYGNDIINKIEVTGNKEVFRLNNELLPMIRLSEVMQELQPFTGKTKAEITAKYAQKREDMHTESLKNKKFLRNKTISFLIIKVNGNKFGLIMDNMLGQEEIVVKPVHSALKDINIFSGASVMGDGFVTMILNMAGISEHANIFSQKGENDNIIHTEKKENTEEKQSVLLFNNGEQETFAVPLPLIKRIDNFTSDMIKYIGDKEFVTIDNISTQLIRLEKVLNVSQIKEQEHLCLMIPKFSKKPFAVIFSSMNDIKSVSLNINTTSYIQDGLLGTLVIDDDIVLFPDLFRLIEIAEPTWYDADKNKKVVDKESTRILYAEDSKFFQKMIKDYLASDGYSVTIAEDGQEALEIFNKKEFDLVLSDLEMPKMDGFEFITEVRKVNTDIPIMALSSLSKEEDILRAKEVGFDEYNIKIDREKLLYSVTNLLARNTSSGENMEALLTINENDFNV